MGARTLINCAYAAIVERMEAKERADFDAQLADFDAKARARFGGSATPLADRPAPNPLALVAMMQGYRA